jgi:hypothetical protein
VAIEAVLLRASFRDAGIGIVHHPQAGGVFGGVAYVGDHPRRRSALALSGCTPCQLARLGHRP